MWQYGWMEKRMNHTPFCNPFSIQVLNEMGGRQRGAYLAVLTDYGWKVVWVGVWKLGLGLEMYQDTRLLWHITTVIRRS
jgi:hypothetical protein